MVEVTVTSMEKAQKAPVLAFVSIRLTSTFSGENGKLETGNVIIKGLQIVEGRDGNPPWVGFPKRKVQDEYLPIVTVDRGARFAICRVVMEAYRQKSEQWAIEANRD